MFYYITNEQTDKVLILGRHNQWKKTRAGEHQKYSLGWKQFSANEKQSIFRICNTNFYYPTYWEVWEVIKHFWLSNAFSPVTKASQNWFSENYHPDSYFELSLAHVIKSLPVFIDCSNQKKTVPLKYEFGNKTSLSYLSRWQSKLSVPLCCGPPDELLPSAFVLWQ